MSSEIAPRTRLSRRHFLALSAGAGSALLLAACAQPAGTSSGAAFAPAIATATPVPPTTTPEPASAQAPAVAADEVRVMASDVLEHTLAPEGWEGAFGQVKFRIHEALHNQESVYYIRTDASDQKMAEEVGLTWVPLLNTAVGMENVNTYYMFGDNRPAVIRWRPGDENYSSLFRYVTVTLGDVSLELSSAEAVEAAITEGAATIDEDAAPVFVNFPLVLWPEGGLTVDSDLKEYLGGGQLFEPVDTANMTATMKLHQCFPGSRYIVTDTSAAPMAPMMSVAAASPTQKLKALGGTDEIWVFGNGIAGSGVMGFQPAIFDNQAGQPAWSPFWDHFTLTWKDPNAARVLRSSAEVRELVKSGELEEWTGTPDTHPNGFVVNCPVPVLAPNTFKA